MSFYFSLFCSQFQDFEKKWTRPILPDSFIPHITCNAKLTPFGNPSVPRTAPCLVQHKFFTIFLFLRPFARRDATITREDSEDFVPNKHCSAMSMLTRNSCFRLVLLSTFWWVFKFSSKKMIFIGYMLRFKQKWQLYFSPLTTFKERLHHVEVISRCFSKI